MYLRVMVKLVVAALLFLLGVWTQSLLPFVAMVILGDSMRKKSYGHLVWCYLQKRLQPYFCYFEWSVALLAALWVLVFVQGNFIGIYTFHTSSMHQTLQVGDVLLVNKLIPGARHACNDIHSYGRSKGSAPLSYGDVIIFNFPEADTLLESRPTESYYYLKRLYGAASVELKDKTELKYLDVKRRPRFVKRLYGLPGDSIVIDHGDCYVNGMHIDFPQESIGRYLIDKDVVQALKDKGVRPYSELTTEKGLSWEIIQQDYDRVRDLYGGLKPDYMLKNFPDPLVFPFDSHLLWNMHYMGPIYIPKKGTSIKLTLSNLPFYSRVMTVFEQNELQVIDGKIWLNGKITDEYTFKMNYYWVIGDNRPHSFDSRFWGFVPENHIIGKVTRVLLSRDIHKKGWIYLRKERFLKKVE
ncbi:signal peptidase I [Saccharicrinis fermentans]|nr:signal peptidase I [Saccharicrinis fermentans]